MAQTYVTTEGELVIPGAYASYKVQAAQAGIGTTGVIALVGEADSGPAFGAETELGDNAFGPDQRAEVLAKYKSGRLVDAYLQATASASDTGINGAPSRIILVKTNVGQQAAATLTNYGELAAKSWGKAGNLIYTSVADEVKEVIPTTGPFAFIPNVASVGVSLRSSGAAAVSTTLSANTTPLAFVSAIDALNGINATGGQRRNVIPAAATGDGSTLGAVATSADTLVFTLTGPAPWATTPVVGDTLVVPNGAPLDGGVGDDNVGAYIVTGVTSTTITATKKSDAGKSGAVVGVLTDNATVSAAPIVSLDDIKVYSPVTITLSTVGGIAGVGKTLEINALSGSDLLTHCVLNLNGAAATFVSTSTAPKVITSAAERKVKLNVSRSNDNVQEEIVAGGQVVLTVGYTGTEAELVITATDITTTVLGGAGEDLALKVADFVTVGDLAAYINAQPGYTASAASASLASVATSALDRGTFDIGTTFGAKVGRIKRDASLFFTAIANNSGVVQLGRTAARAASGLPAVQSDTFLSGGAKGSSTDADFTAALAALEAVRLNFVVPLVSRDASEDILDGLTESTSTYTINSVNAAVKTHCLKMSTLKRRRARQGFLSFRGTFDAAKEAAGAMATQRTSVSFLDVTALNSTGSLVVFQPWMAAVTAAGAQAAAFYKGLTNKGANIYGIAQAAGDWSYTNDTLVEEALLSGLLPLRKHELGGFRWISDQTSYTRDSNFVYNSIQAVYAADTIALSSARQMEDRFAGESLADVSASAARTYLEALLDKYVKLKLIAPSDDAPLGYKDVLVRITNGAIVVSFEAKLAGSVYFIPINFLVSQVEQTSAS